MLVKCKECGKDISNKAISCPNCGYPVTKQESVNLFNNSQSLDDCNRLCPRCGSSELLYETEQSKGLNLYHCIMLVIFFCGLGFMLKMLIVYALAIIIPIYILVRRYESGNNLKITCKKCGCNVLKEQKVYEKMKAIADKSKCKSTIVKPSNSSRQSNQSEQSKWKKWLKFYLICFLIILIYNSTDTESESSSVRKNIGNQSAEQYIEYYNEQYDEQNSEQSSEQQSTLTLDDLAKASTIDIDSSEETESILDSAITYGEPVNVAYGDSIWGRFESTGDNITDIYRVYVPEGTYRVTCKSNNMKNGLFKEFIEGYINTMGYMEYDNTTDFLYYNYNDVFTLEVSPEEYIRLLANSSFIFERIN